MEVSGEGKFSPASDLHAKVGAWFLGPKAENLDVYHQFISKALQSHSKWRRSYCPEDQPYVTEEVKKSDAYQTEIGLIDREMKGLLKLLRNSTPFFSSRYKAHMLWDTSMIGAIGYFATSLWNANNVATEVSPVTTALEIKVGRQLCAMFDYNTTPPEKPEDPPESWGHITCGGSIANIESLWAARNLRYLPQAMKQALDKEADLGDWKNDEVILATGSKKKLIDLDEWEALNVPADSIMALYRKISEALSKRNSKFGLEHYINQYGVSHNGMASVKQGCYIVPATRHYSWDKAGALLGIGQGNMLIVEIDYLGRMKVDKLKEKLEHCRTKKIPVLSVIAVVGTTAEGAVDPIDDILNVREDFRKKGLDFYFHADAAWGGYLRCMIGPVPVSASFVPFLALSDTVNKQLLHLKYVDSITLDPHKSGYIQYPAGSLCYKNGTVRFTLNISATYLFTGDEDPSVGFFGVEGSKPGAAVAATYLHNRVVGLYPTGHGQLLGQANFTTKVLYCLIYTLAKKDDPFKVATYQPLPKGITEEFLEEVLKLTNEEIYSNTDYMKKLSELGPDMLINCLAINWKWPLMGVGEDFKPVWNKSTDSVNAVINKIAITDLNLTKAIDTPDVTSPSGIARKKMFLIRTSLAFPSQQDVAKQLRERVDLDPVDGPLNIIISTNMDPWPTTTGFLDIYRRELRQAIFRSVGAVMEEEHFHGFVVTDAGDYTDEVDGKKYFEVFGDHLPVFSEPQHQYHIIVKVTFETQEEKAKYLHMSAEARKPLIFANAEKSRLEALLRSTKPILMDLFVGFPSASNPKVDQVSLRITDIVRYEHFEPHAESPNPKQPEYFLYGNDQGTYMSHCLAKWPDYHYIVRLSKLPCLSSQKDTAANAEQSALRREYGTLITLQIPDADATVPDQPPLKPCYWYDFTFTAECGTVQTSHLKVAENVYYDNKEINAVHEAHKH